MAEGICISRKLGALNFLKGEDDEGRFFTTISGVK